MFDAPRKGPSTWCSKPGRKNVGEPRVATLPLRIDFVVRHEHADAPHAVALLRARRERTRSHAAKELDELAPLPVEHWARSDSRQPSTPRYHSKVWQETLRCGISIPPNVGFGVMNRPRGTVA